MAKPRPTIQLGQFCAALRVRPRDARYILEQGYVPLGVDVAPEKFVEVAQQKEGTIVGLSALLTTTMTTMKTVIEQLDAAGIRATTKVMIGGAPITQAYADEIGADGYSDNASSAVTLARELANR